MSQFGVVAIARNEGERFRRCLEALRERGGGATVVYVDSGSTDGSVELARGLGVDVIELDLSTPFTAARARNAGFQRLVAIDPRVEFVQFLDGDCEIAEGWLDQALKTMQERPGAAVVFGNTRERFPDRSLYNRLADVDWNMASDMSGTDGEAGWCGGNSVFRVTAFREAGGFDPSVPAGEEPEICQRLRSSGWKVFAIDAEMAWHDSAMFHFRQWAKRQFRTGYGGLDFSTRFGKIQGREDPFRRQIVSARVWGIGWTLALVASIVLGWMLLGPVFAAFAAILLFLVPAAQASRIAAKNYRRIGSLGVAIAYGVLNMLAKPYQLAGQCLYLRDHRAGRHIRLIEHKSVASESRPHAGSAPISS